MKGHESVAVIFGRENGHAVRGGIKGHFKGRRMRLFEHVWNNGLARQVGPLTLASWVFVIAHVIPRPAIKASLPHAGDIVRHEIVAEAVPLIGGHPDRKSTRLNSSHLGIS